MVLACYVGFCRLHHLRFLKREPMLTGILHVIELPRQSTFWRFLAALHLWVAQQVLEVQRRLRQRVWEAAHVQLTEVTLDTDTTVHTLFGNQMGGRKGYNPKNKGKKSYQPILTFLAETKEYVGGVTHRQPARRPGDRRSFQECGGGPAARGKDRFRPSRFGLLLLACGGGLREPELAVHHRGAQDRPSGGGVEGCGMEALAAHRCRRAVRVPLSAGGLGQSVPVSGAAYRKKPQAERPEQYQLFDTPEYTYRVFVTNMEGPLDALVWFYNQRAGAENLIKEANNDAGLAAHPSKRWIMNANWFQIVMLAYNLNCWLQLFNREESEKIDQMRHTTLATARLRFLFLAAKIWRHAGRVGVSYSDHYEEKSVFDRLMGRLRAIAADTEGFAPVIATALRC
jgi:hypothetical protein